MLARLGLGLRFDGFRLVSGAHLNPAVSLALACVGKFSPRKVALFWSAQYLGAFVGAAFTLAIYYG